MHCICSINISNSIAIHAKLRESTYIFDICLNIIPFIASKLSTFTSFLVRQYHCTIILDDCLTAATILFRDIHLKHTFFAIQYNGGLLDATANTGSDDGGFICIHWILLFRVDILFVCTDINANNFQWRSLCTHANTVSQT